MGYHAISGGQVKSILDPSFRYTASFNTDLRKTFARIRRDHRDDPEWAAHTSIKVANAPVEATRVSSLGA
jgi:hypothetical protein